ncbi:hypothetical protein SODALDRAFT_320291 [Sodiomyces alkalinus F11]|uniref:VanZ-like domain-containing protein n=1 Tax=Sodiomyces alkalinus (strain CBS 110278 / VKM F-3762 / F11) TaxID=1314773 RepID=A0A3N2PMN9_SODAK|nr:hypothetical protein SODALDRAFT_320291 [Sodiomyces alkalinus F11]ROT35783.1 hypothetical protein SODALDRAFT_320291 [Sodiomyces alkalinus F11]
MMRIRLPFAGLFFVLLLVAAYVGLSSFHVEPYVNDKVLHFLTFFLLTVFFYWIIDTTRRRTLNLTLVVCTAILGLGSEILQALLPNGRTFDIWDVAANVAGSLAAVGLCTWYHKRMLERRRARRGYGAVPGEADADADLELGESSADVALGQEEGVTGGSPPTRAGRTLEEEVDNWDENAVDDWEGTQADEEGAPLAKGKAKSNDVASGDIGDGKRAD